jgi:hypothetical protein
MYDTTRCSLHNWFKHEFEHLGWMVLAKSKSIDESRSEQERTLMKNKVNVYCEALTGLMIAIKEKISTLSSTTDKADIDDLEVLHKNTKVLKSFVDSTLMSSMQMGGAKKRSKRRTSKKTSKK